MDHLIQKINEQVERLKYLEGTREKNMQILNNRVQEINEEKRKRGTDNNNGKRDIEGGVSF
jgi:hypothetical protein